MEVAIAALLIAMVIANPVALVWVIVLHRRVGRLEHQLARRKAAPRALVLEKPPVREAPPPIPAPAEPSPVLEESCEAHPREAEEEPELEPVPVPIPSGAPKASRPETLEKFIGMKALNWAGVVTSLFAIAYGLKVSFDKGWLGEWGVSLIVYAAGLLFIVLGHWLRRKSFGYVAEGLSALGFGVLYAASYFAHHQFGILSSEAAFIVMAITTLSGAVLTAFYRSQIIAGLIFLGGYLTPVLLATGEDHGGFLLGYLVLLSTTAAVFTYAWRWTFVKLLSPVATYLVFLGWYLEFGSARMGVALPGVFIFLFMFSLSTALPILTGRFKSRFDDIGLFLMNALIGFAFLHDILYSDHTLVMALVTFGMSACFLATYFVFWRQGRRDDGMALSALILSMGFFTAAVPIKFGAWTTAVIWAAEGTFLLALGQSSRNKWILAASVVSHALALWKLAVLLPLHDAAFSPVFNEVFCAWIMVGAAFAASAWWSRREMVRGEKGWLPAEVRAAFFLVHAALTGTLLYVLGASEIVAHFKFNLNGTIARAMPYLWVLGSLLSMIYAAISYFIKEIRLSITGFLFHLVALGFFVAYFRTSHEAVFVLFLNPSFLCGIVMVVLSIIAAGLLWPASRNGRGVLFILYAAVAGGAAYLLGVQEIVTHFERNLNLFLLDAMPYIFLVGTVVPLSYAAASAWLKSRSLALLSGLYYTIALMFFVSFFARYHNVPFTPIINAFFLCGLAHAASYALAARLVKDEGFSEFRMISRSAFIVVLFLLFSAESYWYFFHNSNLGADASLWALASLSVLWALFGATILIIGLVRKIPSLRYTALALFGITLLKVFLMDTASLEPLHRVLGFLTLGGVLIAGSFAYNKLLKIQKEA